MRMAHVLDSAVGSSKPPVLLVSLRFGLATAIPRRRPDGLPDPRPDRSRRLLPEAPGPAPPRGVDLPPLRRPGRPQRPPPPPRLPGRRLPLQGLSAGVQLVHRHPLAG